jgi:beta-phosphoglucomutase
MRLLTPEAKSMSHNPTVIFDMDGVLVDSYQAHFKSWQAVAAEEGLAVNEVDFAAQFGRTSREMIAGWWGEGQFSEEEIARLDDRKEGAFREILSADFPPMPGAVELLRALHDAGFALALGSSGPPENVELVMNRLGARELFEAVVTGKDVTRGKPDPQVFLVAARRLSVLPAQCAVVEDAPAGVDAASAAGMASVGFASTGRTRGEFAAADLTIDSLGELSPAVFRDLIVRNAQKKSR